MLDVTSTRDRHIVGAAVQTHATLEHFKNVDIHLLVETNLRVKTTHMEYLILVVLVLYAARSLDDAVVVVGTVQSQLGIKKEEWSHIHAIAKHVVKTVHVHSRSTLTGIDDRYLALATIWRRNSLPGAPTHFQSLGAFFLSPRMISQISWTSYAMIPHNSPYVLS